MWARSHNFITGFFHRKHQRSVEELIESSSLQAKLVLHSQSLNYAKGIANDEASLELRSSRWEFSKRLYETRLEAENQVDVLRKCAEMVDEAANLKIQDDNLMRFLDCFSRRLDGDINDLVALKKALGSRQDQWEAVLEEINTKKKVRLFFSHAIFMFSDISGLEIGSLLIGGLIGLGTVYMWFFYQGAAGQFVHTYWTLDDLIIQGINIAWIVVGVLIFFEILFRVLFKICEGHMASIRSKTTDMQMGSKGQILNSNVVSDGSLNRFSRIFLYILRKPLRVLLIFIITLLFSTSLIGYLNGTEEFYKFKQAANKPETELEIATIVDKATLRDVYLVGTTSTAAIFLQPIVNEKSNDFVKPSGYFCIWIQILQLFPNPILLFVDPTKDSEPTQPVQNPMYQVLVLDRAQITCHSKGNLCETLLESE